MKDRIVTGIVLSAVLIPLLTITKLLELFQVFMFIFVVIASLEMIRMYETKKKFQLLPKIGIMTESLMKWRVNTSEVSTKQIPPIEIKNLKIITLLTKHINELKNLNYNTK